MQSGNNETTRHDIVPGLPVWTLRTINHVWKNVQIHKLWRCMQAVRMPEGNDVQQDAKCIILPWWE